MPPGTPERCRALPRPIHKGITPIWLIPADLAPAAGRQRRFQESVSANSPTTWVSIMFILFPDLG